MVIVSQLMDRMNISDIVSTLARHKKGDSEKCYTTFTHQGKPVCLRMDWSTSWHPGSVPCLVSTVRHPPRQVNFLTDKAGDCGKGANAVVIRLDFHRRGFGVFLHADNCTGQNKNNCMVQYSAWRVMTNQHFNITPSFLPIGHINKVLSRLVLWSV